MHDINATLRPALGSHSPVRDRHLQGIEGRDKTERQRVTEEYVRPVCHQGALYHARAGLTWGPVHNAPAARRYLAGFSQRLIAVPVGPSLDGVPMNTAARVLYAKFGAVPMAVRHKFDPNSIGPVRACSSRDGGGGYH